MIEFPDRRNAGIAPQRYSVNTQRIPQAPQANRYRAIERSRNDHTVHHATAVVVLLPLRLFLAAGWIRAGSEKLLSPMWWNGEELRNFIVVQHDEALPFFRPVMEHVIAPAAILVAFVVMASQLWCGLAIGIGKRLQLALRWCFVLNVTFILAGRVTPSAFYLVMQTVLLFAIADGTMGVRTSSPSSRTFVAAGVSAGLGALLLPYVRTIDPELMIEDPAMMLALMGTVIAATLLVRRAAHLPTEDRISATPVARTVSIERRQQFLAAESQTSTD